MSTPLVSVIVPNYNHAAYLPKRIDSILQQIFQDFELLLLDDCSQDDSREILCAYAEKDERIQLHFNKENSGSPFAQWNKGVALAKGKYIWIAESDDYCALTMLQVLVDLMESNDLLGIAYAQSTIVDEQGDTISSYNKDYKINYQSDRWDHDFTVSGKVECTDYLIFGNTIPNASGALMRKSVYKSCGDAESHWKLNGDWFFYIKMLMISDLAFCSDHLNYFRFHTNTQRQRATTNYETYDENILILDYIENHVKVGKDKMAIAWERLAVSWGKSLYRQHKNKNFFKENYRLYLFFRDKKPRLLLNLISNPCYIAAGQCLERIGLKKPTKSLLALLFPKKFLA